MVTPADPGRRYLTLGFSGSPQWGTVRSMAQSLAGCCQWAATAAAPRRGLLRPVTAASPSPTAPCGIRVRRVRPGPLEGLCSS
jgi:hypothetical protein